MEHPGLCPEVPSQHEENTIAQTDEANARKNALYHFGREMEVGLASSRLVRSAEHLDADIELNTNLDVKAHLHGKARSETGMIAAGWEQFNTLWARKGVKSDPGVDMGAQKNFEHLMHLELEATRVTEKR